MPVSLVLVDSSVWIQFFRAAQSSEAVALDALLAAGPVATCAPIRTEVVSGARTLAQFHQLRTFFAALVQLALPDDAWAQIEDARFTLARRGQQASLVDLLIAVTAHSHRVDLWTVDESLKRMASHLHMRLYQPIGA